MADDSSPLDGSRDLGRGQVRQRGSGAKGCWGTFHYDLHYIRGQAQQIEIGSNFESIDSATF